MKTPRPPDITHLLVAWGGGEQSALDELIPLVYAELQHLAQHYLRGERRGSETSDVVLIKDFR